MNALMIALTMSLAEGDPSALPLRMSLFNVEAEAEVIEVPAATFSSLIVAQELPSYAELMGGESLPSSVAIPQTRPWTDARPAAAESVSSGWLKDWTQR
jgi:hypothetical protein